MAVPILTWLIFTLRRAIKPVREDDLVAEIETSPPVELSPIEISSLIEQRLTPRDLCAELISLAIHSYLKIEKINNEWHLIKLERDTASLPNVSRLLMQQLFASKQNIALSDISLSSSYNYQTLSKRIFQKFCHRNYFEHDVMIRFASSSRWLRLLSIYVLSIMITLFFTGLINTLSLTTLWVVLIAIIPGVMLATWIPTFYRRQELSLTDKGLEIKRLLLGFKRYLMSLDFTDLKYSGSAVEDHQRLMEYLPYVVSFHLESKWREFYFQTGDWYSETKAEIYLTYQVYFEAMDAIMAQFARFRDRG